MNTIRMIKPGLDTLTEANAGCLDTFAKPAPTDPEATMATVLMTRLHDTKMQDRFHRLMVLDADEKVLGTYPLNRKVTLVGRSRRCQIQLKDVLVSVRHLSVSVANDACVADDLGSSNGTFVNGERLNGVRVLKDGDEIMLGNTILRFAARGTQAVVPSPDKVPRMTFFNKRFCIPTAAVFCLAMAAALIFHGIDRDPERLAASAMATYEKSPDAAWPATANGAAKPQLPVAAGGARDLTEQSRSETLPRIQLALEEYAAGRLETAIQSLEAFSAAKELTSDAFQAKQTLDMLNALRTLHTRALQAQEQKKFSEAIEAWDSILALDMELVGDRPSFFARQAEAQVQALTYEFALDAFQQKNNEKARQLCQVILQIDPRNQQALALLAKIDSKA
jgi:pSer/pThr/pTyr-binding forkhead associated (FHA) protein